MRTRTRELERMRGRGVVTDETGKTCPVTDDLSRTQDELYDGPGGPPIPTSKDIVGRILPVTSFDGSKTLQMADGRKFKFFYKHSDGSIALNQWIG
jgi:hypothetical protein